MSTTNISNHNSQYTTPMPMPYTSSMTKNRPIAPHLGMVISETGINGHLVSIVWMNDELAAITVETDGVETFGYCRPEHDNYRFDDDEDDDDDTEAGQ